MGYLKDYIHYASGTECPEEFIYWSGLSLLGHVLGTKVWVEHGNHFGPRGNLYVCLVGDPGTGKNTALRLPIKIMTEHFPNLMVSASIQSREDIADLMASEDCCNTWKDDEGWHGVKGKIHEYRPFYVLNDELASFLSLDKIKMATFLTDIYDTDRFATGFKGQRREDPLRKQWFMNPHFSLLAGAVPTWFMNTLKMDLFTGGLGRRLIIVYAERTKTIAFPNRPPDAAEAYDRVVKHLKLASLFKGPLRRTPAALKWWENWYPKTRNKVQIDPILQQYQNNKHILLLKLATTLRMTEQPFGNNMEVEHLEFAESLLTKLEPNIVKLTSGIGRNELAGIATEMLNTLGVIGGVIQEKKLLGIYFRQLQEREFNEVLSYLNQTGQIVRGIYSWEGVNKQVVFLPKKFEEYEKNGGKI